MDGTQIAVLSGALATVAGALAASVRAASTAYQEAINRRAAELEHKRLAEQAVATVKAKDAEIAELKKENEWLKSLVGQEGRG